MQVDWDVLHTDLVVLWARGDLMEAFAYLRLKRLLRRS